MNRTTVIKALRAFFNDTHGCTFVGVPGERVLDVTGVEKLDIANVFRTPYLGVFTVMQRIVMAFHAMECVLKSIEELSSTAGSGKHPRMCASGSWLGRAVT